MDTKSYYLVYNGKKLEQELHTVKAYAIKNGATLYLVLENLHLFSLCSF